MPRKGKQKHSVPIDRHSSHESEDSHHTQQDTNTETLEGTAHEIGGYDRQHCLRFWQSLTSEECKDIIMLDDGAIQRAVAVMRLEMGSVAEAVPFPANIPLDKVEEVQANFLQAMVYQEGVLVFRHSADLSYLVVLRALQDNLLKYMEIRVVQHDFAYLAMFVIWHLQSRFFWSICAVAALLLATPTDKRGPIIKLGALMRRSIAFLFKDEPNALLVREKVRGVAGAVIVLQVLWGHAWFAFSWALVLVPVLLAFAASLPSVATHRSFYTIHKIIRVLCRIGLIFVLIFQDFRSYPTLIVTGRTFAPEVFEPIVAIVVPVFLFGCVILTRVPAMVLPTHWMISALRFRSQRPYVAAVCSAVGLVVTHWYIWGIPQPWWLPVAAALSYACYSTLHHDLQTLVLGLGLLCVVLPGDLMFRLCAYIQRKWENRKSQK